MKKLFSLFAAFVALAFLTFSCSKEGQDLAPKKAKATHSASAYEYVGEQHNAGLDFYLEHADFKNKFGEVEPQTIAFGETIGYNREESAKILKDPRVAEIIYSKAPDEALATYYKQHGQIQELKYFEQMRAALSAKSANADEAVAKLTEIERAVEADKSLEPESQISLLQGLAVGKHSAQYWYAQNQLGEKSPWIIKNTIATGGGTTTGGTTTALRINWWKVGLSDLVGGLTGAGGGPTGVVIGGLAGSIKSVIDQLP